MGHPTKIVAICGLIAFSLSGFGQSVEQPADEQVAEPSYSRSFGFGIGAALPLTFGNEYNHYEKLFGSANAYPMFWVQTELFPLWWGFDVSASFRFGFYKDWGKSLRRPEEFDPSLGNPLNRDILDSEVDASQKSILTLIPVQPVLQLNYQPTWLPWIKLSAWGGLSYTYVENSTKASIPSNVDSSAIEAFINSGWNTEQVVGMSMNFDISSFDPRGVYSMKLYGIDRILLSPYFQVVTTQKNQAGVFDREELGLMFTFESE